jgi:hypothetical protein
MAPAATRSRFHKLGPVRHGQSDAGERPSDFVIEVVVPLLLLGGLPPGETAATT